MKRKLKYMNKLKQNLQLRTQKIYNLQQLYSVTTSSRNTVTRLTHVLFLINLHPQFVNLDSH